MFASAGGKGYLTKYTPSGVVSWERWGFSVPTGVTVTSGGNVAIIREDGVVAKYANNGNRLWMKQLPFKGASLDYSGMNNRKLVGGINEELFVAGKHVYYSYDRPSCEGTTYYEERSYLRLYKLDATGAQKWMKNVSDHSWIDDGCIGAPQGWNLTTALGMDADNLGNVYLAGGYARRIRNSYGYINYDTNAMSAKYNRAGSQVWFKRYGSDRDDHASSVAAYNGTEVYVSGVTEGDSTAHPNKGYTDAFLRKMDGSGNQVWTR